MRKITLLLVMQMLMFSWVFAQTQTVTGKITDEKGAAVAGASVIEKGTKNGTSTNADGTFTINVKKGAVLIIQGVGLQTINIKASEQMAIRMNSLTENLNEVVVTALGIKREKRELGISTQTVGGDALNKSGTGNALSEMEGKVSGLTVINSSGDPGSGTYIRLRGAISLTGSNQPLIVIDGVPIDNSVNNYDPTNAGFQASGPGANLTGGTQPTNRGLDINPNDIESINVLKGPAAALYGMQGSNGVVLITTKKGSGKKGTSVTFNSSNSMDKVSQLPALQTQYAQGTGGSYRGPQTGTSISWGPNIDTLYWDGSTSYKWDRNGNIVGASSPLAKKKVTPYDRYNFFKTGFTTNNSVALSGSNDKTNYRISLGNLYQTGIIPLTNYSKTTVTLSGESKITERLHASATINYINSFNNKAQQGSNVSGVMLGLLRTPPTFDNANGYANAANNPLAYSFSDGTQRNYRGGGGYDNPYWTVNEDPTKSDLNRIFGSLQADFKAFEWMDITYRLGGDAYTQSDKNAYNIGSNAAPAGAVYLIDYNNSQFNSDLIINMHKNFSEQLTGSLLIGQNYFTQTQNTRFAQGTGLAVSGFLDMSNATSYFSSESEVRHVTSALYANAELGYKKMLYLTVTGRRETTSTLPKQNNTYFFPSASLSWIFTELEAFKNNKVLSFGKLRLSYADVAKDYYPYSLNTPFTSASFRDGWTPNGITFPVNSTPGYQISSATATVGNPNLKPENTASYEAGLDLSFLQNKIGLNATAYYNKSTDLIFPVSIPYSTGFAAENLNAATVTNKGLELTLSVVPLKSKDFNWTLNFNWSKNISKVVSLYPGIDEFFMGGFGGGEAGIFAVRGQPFGVIYGSTTPHVNLNDLKSPLLINDDKTDPGYGQPLSGGAGPNLVIGNPNPDWIGSVVSSLSYKQFSLGFQIDIRHGGDMWNGTKGALENKGTAGVTANRGTSTVFHGLLGHLDANGDVVHYDANGNEVSGAGAANTVSSIYSQYYWQSIGNSFSAGQETNIENGGFTRLRQVSLSYQFPKNIFGKNSFTNLSVTFFANNLWVLTKYTGVDPETNLSGPSNIQGLEYFNNPGTKTYGVRLNLGL